MPPAPRSERIGSPPIMGSLLALLGAACDSAPATSPSTAPVEVAEPGRTPAPQRATAGSPEPLPTLASTGLLSTSPALPPPPRTFVCPSVISDGALFAELWPGCTVDMAVGGLAARCESGHSCMRPCRIERAGFDRVPDPISQVFEYDAEHRLTRSLHLDPSFYVYEGGRLAFEGYGDPPPSIRMIYSPPANGERALLVAMVTADTSEPLYRFEYDDQKRLVRSVATERPGAEKVEERFVYDAAGRVSSDFVAGRSHELEYDGDGRLASMREGGGVTRYFYAATGRLARETYDRDAFHTESDYTYDARGRLESALHKGRQPSSISESSHRYLYDSPAANPSP